MANPFEGDGGDCRVLVNGEGQYSVWPALREVPRGWTAMEPVGTRQRCLDWIELHWTDMRPRSLAERLPN